jgi:hypothetical protein
MLLQALLIPVIGILLLRKNFILAAPVFLIWFVLFLFLNFGFLRYVNKREKRFSSIGKAVYAIFMRNCAWIAAVLSSVKAKTMASFLRQALKLKI